MIDKFGIKSRFLIINLAILGYLEAIILNSKFLHGKKILPFITKETNDIDDLNDFKKK